MEAAIIADFEMNGRKSLRTIKAALNHLRQTFGNFRALDITSDRISGHAAAV
jgi:hypothetical protein